VWRASSDLRPISARGPSPQIGYFSKLGSEGRLGGQWVVIPPTAEIEACASGSGDERFDL
jgi:hypothetical protein